MPRKRRAKAQPDRKACAVYARFSSDRQREESIEDQVRVCTEWAEAHGLRVAETYADHATSGTTDRRPEFQRMVSDAREGRWATLVVYKLDRFARDRFDSAIYRKRLAEMGVAVASAMETIPDSPEGIILTSLLEGMNEYYSRNLAQNVLRGMEGNAEKCLVNGVRLYGYRTGADGRYEVDEEEARFVRGAFEMAAAGRPRKEIVRWLRESGSRTPRGTEWEYNNLRTMLTNEKYTGTYSWGSVRVEGGMPAIVSRETFEAVSTVPREKPRSHTFPLSGRLVWEDGTPFRGTSGTGCNGRTYLYYSIPTGHGHELRYRKETVEGTAMSVLRRAMSEPGVAESMADGVMDEVRGWDLNGGVRSAKRRLGEIEASKARLLASIEAGVDPAAVAPRVNELSSEEADTRRYLEEHPEVPLPTREWVLSWLQVNLFEREPEDVLANLVGRCVIDSSGKFSLTIPWLPQNAQNAQKTGERPGRGQFAGVKVGSPYQIRTGDLRLERAAS